MPSDLMVRVDAGVSLADLDRVLAAQGQWLPVDPADGSREDTVGGLIAAGIEGMWAGGYGRFSDRILALSVFVPAFGVLRLGRAVVKNVAGYALGRLFWGSRGTFGIILDAVLKVAPRPPLAAVWRGAGADAGRLFAAAEAIAQDLALAATVREAGRDEAIIVWRGRSEALLDRLREALGTESGCEPGGLLRSRPEVLQGCVERTMVEGLEALAGQTDGLVVDRRSGSFWAAFDALSAAARFAEAVRRLGGACFTVAGTGTSPGPVSDPALAAVYRRLKAAWDPEGVLPTWGGGP